MSEDTRYHIIGRGKAGWHAAAPNVKSSGGDLEDRPCCNGGIQYGYRSIAAR